LSYSTACKESSPRKPLRREPAVESFDGQQGPDEVFQSEQPNVSHHPRVLTDCEKEAVYENSEGIGQRTRIQSVDTAEMR